MEHNKSNVPIILALGFVGAFVVIAAICANDGDPPSRSGGRSSSAGKVYAWAMAKKFVKGGLKSPSTADFGGMFSDHQSAGDVVTILGGGKFRVRAWVDSQNSFGAMVRTQFTCELRAKDDNMWSCTSLTFD